jgi:flagellar hook-length control protein FliK
MTVAPIALAIAQAFNSSGQKFTREGEAGNAFSLMVEELSEHAHSTQDRESSEIKRDTESAETTDGKLPEIVFSALGAVTQDLQGMPVPADLPALAGKARSAGVSYNTTGEQPFLPEVYPLLQGEVPTPAYAQKDAEAREPQLASATEQAKLSRFALSHGFSDGETPGVEQDSSIARLDADRASEEASAVTPVAISDETLRDELPPAIQILSQISNAFSMNTGQAAAGAAARQILPLYLPISPSSELKSIRFMLQPENLGDVEVTLRRTGPETKVTIAVASRAVAETLSRDMSILEDRLEGLLAMGAANTVNVSMEIRDPESSQGQYAESRGERDTADSEHSGGHGFGREGKSEPGSNHRPLALTRDELNEENTAERPAAGSRRVV